ncbi:MAG: hypothetical protein WCJ30_00410 [Deltaproteobacteria bacterium]
MRSPVVACLLACLVACALVACRPRSQAPAASAARWVEFRDPHQRFRCELPAAPVRRRVPGPLVPGAPEIEAWVLRIDANTAYTIGSTDFGNTPIASVERGLDGARDSMLRGQSATLLGEVPVQSLDAVGREITARLASGRTLRARLYFRRGALVQLVVVTPPDAPATDARRFLDSLQLAP